MFLHLPVSHSVHRRGGVYPSMQLGYVHPLGRRPLQANTPAPRQAPPRDGHWSEWYISYWNALLLPSANKVCEGYVFTHVCLSTGGFSRPTLRGDWGVWLGGGLSRPTPKGEVEGAGWGVSRLTPGGSPGPHWGGLSRQRRRDGDVSQHALRQTPPNRRLLLREVRILLEYILVLV